MNVFSVPAMRGARRARGFTLIELMIVVAIIGILAGLAIAGYRDAIMKSRRSTATGCLLERAQFMERFYAINLQYHQTRATPAVAVPTPDQPCAQELNGHYTFSFVAPPTATAYTLQATPQGVQATADTLCGRLTLNHRGLRGENGTATNANQCW